jgi:hypothetical protein
MNTTRHPVDFPYTRAELDALFHYARAHDGPPGAIGEKFTVSPHGYADVSHE